MCFFLLFQNECLRSDVLYKDSHALHVSVYVIVGVRFPSDANAAGRATLWVSVELFRCCSTRSLLLLRSTTEIGGRGM